MTEPFKICKIMILYMLDQVDAPLTTSQLSSFILNGEYTNYFTFQQSLNELLDSDFIRAEDTHAKTSYHLTEEGKESLAFFKDEISPEILQDIDQYLQKNDYELKSQTAIKAEYYETPSHEYAVRLQVLEKKAPLIDLTIKVPTEKEAEKVAENWEQKNEALYAFLMKELL